MWQKRLKQAREAAGFKKQIWLARKIRVSGATLSDWESGNQKPKGDNLVRLCEALNVSEKWLMSGIVKEKNKGGKIKTQTVLKIPAISSVSAGDWMTHIGSQDVEYRESTANVSSDSFYTQINGTSMINTKDARSIPHGAYILVDTKVEAVNGSIVIATIEESGEATCKELVIDGGHKYLMPLNPDYKPLVMTGTCRIIGVVVRSEVDYV